MEYNYLNINRIAILLLLILVSVSPVLAQEYKDSARKSANNDSIHVAVYRNFPPFSFIDDHGNPQGFSIAIAKEIGKRLDKPVAYRFIGFDEVADSAVRAECNLFVGVHRNNCFGDEWVFSKPIIQSQFSFYCGKNHIISGLNDLCDKRIATPPLLPLSELLETKCEELNVRKLSPRNAIMALAEGEIEIAVVPSEVGDYFIREFGLQAKVDKLDTPTLKFDYVVAIPAEKVEILGQIDDIISSLKKDGQLATLRGKWLNPPTEGKKSAGGYVYLIIVLIVLMGMLFFYIALKNRNFRIYTEAEKNVSEALKNELEDLKKQFDGYNLAASAVDIGFFAIRDEDGILGRFVYVNYGLEKITGYTFEELSKKSFVELFEGEDLEKVIERYKLRRRGEDIPEAYEVIGIRSDGERRPIELSVRLAHLSEGDLTLGIVKDLSREKNLQKKLRESDQNFRAMLSSMPNGALVLNNQRILYINNAFRQLIGKSPEWIRSSGISRILPPVHRARIEALINNLIDGKEAPKEIQFELLGPDDDLVLLTARPRAVSYFGESAVLFIIDNKVGADSQSASKESRPTTGFAKATEDLVLDYNNSIMSIVGAASRLSNLTENNPEELEFTRIIEKESERLGELTGKLLSITKESDEKSGRVISVHSVIRDAIELLPTQPSVAFSIKTFFNARPDTIRGNLSQIHQAVLNLMVNAVETMPQGGDLTVITGNSVFESPRIISDESVDPGRYVWILIKDNGPGIVEPELENIFKPFSGAGRVGAGFGLGLSLVQKLVKRHQGFISVESELGKGTTFTIYFPEVLPIEAESCSEKKLPRGDETVLVVDDEPHIRTVLDSMLNYLGYKVLLASNGAEAIEIMRSKSKEISLVLLDIIMPEMSGEEAYRNIKNIKPEAKIVISTGYARDQTLSDLLQQGADSLIRKPYSVGTIARVIRETLDGVK